MIEREEKLSYFSLKGISTGYIDQSRLSICVVTFERYGGREGG